MSIDKNKLFLIFLTFLIWGITISINTANKSDEYIHGKEIELPPPSSPFHQFSGNTGKSDNQVTQLSSDPLIIYKSTNPKYSDLSDGPLCVSVEIKNNKKMVFNSNLNDIYIREIIDDDLRVINSGIFYYKSSNLNEICKYKADLYRNNNLNTLANDTKNDDGIEFIPYDIDYPVFIWDNIVSEGNSEDNIKLINFLKDYFGVELAKPYINKVDDELNNKSYIYINDSFSSYGRGNTIEMFIDEDIDLNKSILKLNGGRNYEFKIKRENGMRMVYDWITILHIHIDSLSFKDSFMYWYYVNPKKSGIFGTETIVKIYDYDYHKWPHINIFHDIDIKDLKNDFRVDVIYNKHRIYNNEILNVIYEITYLGTGIGPNCDEVEIKLDVPERDYFYIDEFGNSDDNYNLIIKDCSQFVTNKTMPVPIRIKYTEAGIYKLPGIWIDGNHKRFDDKLVSVDPRTNKFLYWIPAISIGLSFILILIGYFELRTVHKELRIAQIQFRQLIYTLEQIKKKLK